MKLIVGLGNPGAGYRETRHNAGARAVEKLAKQKRFVFKPDRSFKSLLATGKIAGQTVCLALPQTFMNLSGEAVGTLMKKKRIAGVDILVVYDDVALPLGEIKMKPSGSDGGHNGLASVIERLGTRDVGRLRLGICYEGSSGELSGYVLSKFDKKEHGLVEEMLKRAIESMEVWAAEGIDAAMNRYNKKKKN